MYDITRIPLSAAWSSQTTWAGIRQPCAAIAASSRCERERWSKAALHGQAAPVPDATHLIAMRHVIKCFF